jgi:hypothetical protein
VTSDGSGVISSDRESRLNIAAQQELRTPMPNLTDETVTDAKKVDLFYYLAKFIS